MRFFTAEFSPGFRRLFEAMPEAPPAARSTRPRALEVARAAARLKHEEGLLVVGLDLAGQEKGYPAEDHRAAYQVAHEAFLGKTVHAGEDYGPESIFQAIGDLHADRIGHGTWLFDETKIHDARIKDRKAYVERLAQFVADKRITIEVCLTSNQQTVPELAARPAPAPVRRDAQAPALARPSAPTTGWSRTPPSPARSRARSRPSR